MYPLHHETVADDVKCSHSKLQSSAHTHTHTHIFFFFFIPSRWSDLQRFHTQFQLETSSKLDVGVLVLHPRLPRNTMTEPRGGRTAETSDSTPMNINFVLLRSLLQCYLHMHAWWSCTMLCHLKVFHSLILSRGSGHPLST